MVLTPPQVLSFQQKIYNYYQRFGRSFPWRGSGVTPYEILVSEVMLQQTQSQRVIPKYRAFIQKLPDFLALATAPQSQVLLLWSGLGYNRRALFLKRCAQEVMDKYRGILSADELVLKQLPGIGTYTAAAIAAFAFNKPVVLIETNVRTVFIQEFFEHKKDINDDELLPLIKQVLDYGNPRRWYWALMDYGAHLKKQLGNLNRKSAHYTKQSKFVGSDRQIRGMILKLLLTKPRTEKEVITHISGNALLVKQIIDTLRAEGFITITNNQVSIR